VLPGRHGYWLVGSDGEIFAFGDARYVESLASLGVSGANIVGRCPPVPYAVADSTVRRRTTDPGRVTISPKLAKTPVDVHQLPCLVSVTSLNVPNVEQQH